MDFSHLTDYYKMNPISSIYQNEDRLIKDMEYLQQMFPREAKKYQKKISDELDRLDYKDSIIYDEYPDQMCMYRIAREITLAIRLDEEKEKTQMDDGDTLKWEWLEGLVQIILVYEVFKRRHQTKRHIVRFY